MASSPSSGLLFHAPVSVLTPIQGKLALSVKDNYIPECSPTFSMLKQESVYSLNKWIGWGKLAYTHGYFLMQIGPFGLVLVFPSDESVRTKGSLLPISFISHLSSTASQLSRYLPGYDILPFLVLAHIIHSWEIYDRHISATHKFP